MVSILIRRQFSMTIGLFSWESVTAESSSIREQERTAALPFMLIAIRKARATRKNLSSNRPRGYQKGHLIYSQSNWLDHHREPEWARLCYLCRLYWWAINKLPQADAITWPDSFSLRCSPGPVLGLFSESVRRQASLCLLAGARG